MDPDAADNQSAQDDQFRAKVTPPPSFPASVASPAAAVDRPDSAEGAFPKSKASDGTHDPAPQPVGEKPHLEPEKEREQKTHRGKKCDQDDEKTPTERALELARELNILLFHTPDDEAFASFPVNGHRETFALEDRAFERWFVAKYYKREGSTLSKKDFAEVRAVLVGEARYIGPEICVHVRLAEDNGVIYLDLANEHWEVVKITSEGWQIVSLPPVMFRRVRGMKSLPRPTRGGSITALRPFVNVGTDEDAWKLVVSWLVAALRPTGPYPILPLQGIQGSAKSTLAEVLRRLIDPNTAPLRAAPGDERDLMISAAKRLVSSFRESLLYSAMVIGCALSRSNRKRLFNSAALYRFR
jgi:hypothetical protein